MLTTFLKGIAFFIVFATLGAVYVQSPETFSSLVRFVDDAKLRVGSVDSEAYIPATPDTQVEADGSFSLAHTLADLIASSQSYRCTVHTDQSARAHGTLYIAGGDIRGYFVRTIAAHSDPVTTHVLYTEGSTYVWNEGHDGYRIPGAYVDTALSTTSLYYACRETDVSHVDFALPRGRSFVLPNY